MALAEQSAALIQLIALLEVEAEDTEADQGPTHPALGSPWQTLGLLFHASMPRNVMIQLNSIDSIDSMS